jgi:hypothetical protein
VDQPRAIGIPTVAVDLATRDAPHGTRSAGVRPGPLASGELAVTRPSLQSVLVRPPEEGAMAEPRGHRVSDLWGDTIGVKSVRLRDGTFAVIRPLRSEDRDVLRNEFEHLTAESR